MDERPLLIVQVSGPDTTRVSWQAKVEVHPPMYVAIGVYRDVLNEDYEQHKEAIFDDVRAEFEKHLRWYLEADDDEHPGQPAD